LAAQAHAGNVADVARRRTLGQTDQARSERKDRTFRLSLQMTAHSDRYQDIPDGVQKKADDILLRTAVQN
jgi:hypothetical protein